jgi:hypothetical protein
MLKTGGVVLCRNAYQPSVQRDAANSLACTADATLLAKTATIGLDEMGLEFSIKNSYLDL